MAAQEIWEKYLNFDHYYVSLISHTLRLWNVPHIQWWDQSVSEHKAWEQSREEGAAQFMQGLKECSAVCL